MIKLIAMDFDWTLIDHSNKQKRVSAELINELNEFIKKGNYAGIVSGRNVWEFENEIRIAGAEFGNPFPNILISREAYIWKYENNDYIGDTDYNNNIKKEILSLNVILSKYISEILDLYKRTGISVSNFFIYGDFAVEIHVSSEYADKAIQLMKEFVIKKGIKDAAVHRNGTMLTVFNNKAGKGNTLLALSKRLGIKPSEVLAIGDNYNDISMIDGKIGFIGGCVGNADDSIKKIVKDGGGYIGNGFASHGVLDIIEQVKRDGML